MLDEFYRPENKDEAVKRIAFVIWQGKNRRGIGSTSDENYFDAEKIYNESKRISEGYHPSIERIIRKQEV